MTSTYTATVDVDTAENFEFVCTTLLTTLCAAGFPSQHSLKVHFPGIFLRKNSQNPVQYVCTWVLMLYCVNLQCKPGCVCYRILVYTKPMDSVFHALWLTCSSSDIQHYYTPNQWIVSFVRSDWLTQARDILHYYTPNQWIVLFARSDWLTQARDILQYYTPDQWIVFFARSDWLLKLRMSCITIYQTSE